MKPKRTEPSGMEDMFRSTLSSIINMKHPLVRLAHLIDWSKLEHHFSLFYAQDGRPGVPIRLVVGLHLLKHVEALSDEAVCASWERDPYMQYFCGEEYFQHRMPLERSGLTHFRHRVGEAALEILLQESLAAAHRAGAIDARALADVAVDTTVQEKAIAHPTDHALLRTAIEHLGEAAKGAGITLRQSYVRVTKTSSIKAGRYVHAKQMKRAKREQRFMRVRLKRLIRDVERKQPMATNASMAALVRLDVALRKAAQFAQQKRGDKDYVYSWHAPETECIGKGKARKPWEFGCKVSLATNTKPARGGHFILHAQALHGRPYDGHTLKGALEHIQKITGRMPSKVAVDRGYKGHGCDDYPATDVFITGQKRGVTEKIKRWMKRRTVIEPIIGHTKNDGLMGRNYLHGRQGDRINATLAAAGFNLRQLLRFLRLLLSYFLTTLRRKIFATTTLAFQPLT